MIEQIFSNLKTFLENTNPPLWQDIAISSIFIPIIILLSNKIINWIKNKSPKNRLLKGYQKKGTLIFLPHYSGAINQNTKNLNQIYISEFPAPTPRNKTNIQHQPFTNIDPVWSASDGKCASDIFNILGSIGKVSNIRIADIFKDWEDRTSAVFSIGGNPKTHQLINECQPIYFTGLTAPFVLKIDGHDTKIVGQLPHDGGIIQKTYYRDTNLPVFILAGLGTLGTEITGYVLSKYYIELGKLYGSIPFCILVAANTTKGSTYYEIKGVYPKPPVIQKLLYSITFLKWEKKKVFPT